MDFGGLAPGVIRHEHRFSELRARLINCADLKVSGRGVHTRMKPLVQGFFQYRRETHGIKVTFKGTARHPGEFVDVGKEAVEVPLFVKAHVKRPPKRTVNFESALNKEFSCGRLPPDCGHREHRRALYAHRAEAFHPGVRFFGAFCRIVIGNRQPRLRILFPGHGLRPNLRFNGLSAHHLPGKTGSHSRHRNCGRHGTP